jgi:uncharacterized protein (DUF1697 family)
MRYVALLRGINVGTARRIAMSDLRALLAQLGFTEVRTLLNSGNAVFSAAKGEPRKTADRIARALEAEKGISVSVMVLTSLELAAITAANTLLEIADTPSRLLVGILRDRADADRLADIAKADWGDERIALGGKNASAGRAVYMWMPAGVIDSRLNAAVAKALGDRVTARNWATMLKLQALAGTG